MIHMTRTWIKHHPDWEYRLWTDEDNRNLIKENYGEFLYLYDSFWRNIQRADAIRYFILYKFGGLYVDLDFECFKNFEPVLNNHSFIIGCEPTDHAKGLYNLNRLLCNALIASVPKHPFLLMLINQMHMTHNYQADDVLTTTGPILVNNSYNHYSKHWNDIKVYEPKLFYPLTGGRRNSKRIPSYAYAAHRWKNTWTGDFPSIKIFNGFTFFPCLDSVGNDTQQLRNLETAYHFSLHNKQIVAFNTDNWSKHKRSSQKDLKISWKHDKGIYFKDFVDGYPDVDGYEKHENKDSVGFDLIRWKTKDMNKLKQIADNDPWCIGFNSEGYLKYKSVSLKSANFFCFYKKIKTPVIPIIIEGFTFHPHYDSEGNDNSQLNIELVNPISEFHQPLHKLLNIDNLNKIAKKCIELNGKGFNLSGYIKSDIKPENEWKREYTYSYMGLFIKN